MAAASTGISQRSNRQCTASGRTSADAPRTSATLATFDPSTLPTASPGASRVAATRLTTNSGAEVPNAMTVAPMMMRLTPNEAASVAAARTVSHAPPIRMTSPTAIRVRSRSTDRPLLVSGFERRALCLVVLAANRLDQVASPDQPDQHAVTDDGDLPEPRHPEQLRDLLERLPGRGCRHG